MKPLDLFLIDLIVPAALWLLGRLILEQKLVYIILNNAIIAFPSNLCFLLHNNLTVLVLITGALHEKQSVVQLCTLWNPNIHYRLCKGPLLIPILNQINPVHTTPSYPVRSILIVFTHLYPSGFLNSFLYAFLLCLICTTCPAHLIFLDLIIVINSQVKKWKPLRQHRLKCVTV
jgi:hypothetical protein